MTKKEKIDASEEISSQLDTEMEEITSRYETALREARARYQARLDAIGYRPRWYSANKLISREP